MSDKTKPDETPFFVGYINAVPKKLALFVLIVAGGYLAGMGLASFAISSSTSDPGPGAFIFNQRFDEAGILQFRPYPVLRLPADDKGNPARTMMLSGQGKRGVFQQGENFKDQPVQLRGVPIKRGDITMIQVAGGRNGMMAPGEGAPLSAFKPSEPVDLGKWRLTGEICDGKCYTGAMRPGRGLAHKACANLCIDGGIPPVFVSSGPVEGQTFFLLADENGDMLSDRIEPLAALYIDVEGDIEQLDDLMIFRMDLDSVRVLK